MNARILASMAVLAVGSLSSAEPSRGLGKWKGEGATFDTQGQAVGTFTVELTRTAIDADTIEMNGTVALSNGRSIPLRQRSTHRDNTFTLESNQGKGAGVCVGRGLCESYHGEGNRFFATTVVMDSPGSMRLLITELENGKAVRFIRENLTLENKG
jgi:hypothetical protein